MNQSPPHPRKVLVVYTSVGMGHKVVGQSIAAALRKHERIKVDELDIFKQYEAPFTRLFQKGYTYVITEAKWIWSWLYKSSLTRRYTLPVRVFVAELKSKKFGAYVAKKKPDMIITTHTAASAMVVALKRSGQYTGRFAISFSDWHFHPYWFYREADRIFVQTSEQVKELMSRGYPRERISLVGMAVKEDFSKHFSEGDIYERFTLSRVKPLVVLMGGSRGWGIKLQDVEELVKTKYDIQIVVICGTDDKLRREVVEMIRGKDVLVRAFGFLTSEEVAQLFYVAKVLVTKPGGSTIGEALASSLPMILVNPLPAMEEQNQDFLASRRAAVVAKSSVELRQWVERMLQDQEFYHEIKKQVQSVGAKSAATKVAQELIDMLPS